MSLNNIKKMKDERGFTIVELLIVIIVIGILAAIIIIAYQGITKQANTTKNQTTAAQVQKIAEAFAAGTGNGTYPQTTADFTNASNATTLPTNVCIELATTATASASCPNQNKVLSVANNNLTVIDYKQCSSGAGYQITYWDYSGGAETLTTSGSGKFYSNGSQTTCAVPIS